MAQIYPSYFLDCINGRIKLIEGTIKVMLVTDRYEFSRDHSKRSDVQDFEAHGKGYDVGGIELVGKRLELIDYVAVFSADMPRWTNATIRAAGYVAYHVAGYAPMDELICYDEFDEEKISSSGLFEIEFPGGVILDMGQRE